MPRRRPSPPAPSNAILASWRRQTPLSKRIVKIAAAISIVLGAVFATDRAISQYQNILPAHRGWVHEQIDEITKPMILAMDKQAVATDRQTLFQLKDYLAKAEGDPAAKRSPIVQDRIEELKRQIKDTQTRIQRASDGK